tara:strand:- start:3444 stop:4067 length:624 start_codon:yes stop_codon:yes gene_type:complete
MYNYLVQGGILMFPLLLCSIYSLAWFFQKLITIFEIKNDVISPSINLIYQELNDIETISYVNYLNIVKKHDKTLYNFFFNFKEENDFDDWIEKKLYLSNTDLTSSNQLIEFIIRSAPILGILGTVIGIIITFEGLDVSSYESFDVIIGGISQALNTTAYGLFISIFSIISLNSFNSFVENKKNKERIILNSIYNLIIKTKVKSYENN